MRLRRVFPSARESSAAVEGDYDHVWRRKARGGLRRISEKPCRVLGKTEAGYLLVEYWSGARIVACVHPRGVVQR